MDFRSKLSKKTSKALAKVIISNLNCLKSKKMNNKPQSISKNHKCRVILTVKRVSLGAPRAISSILTTSKWARKKQSRILGTMLQFNQIRTDILLISNNDQVCWLYSCGCID